MEGSNPFRYSPLFTLIHISIHFLKKRITRPTKSSMHFQRHPLSAFPLFSAHTTFMHPLSLFTPSPKQVRCQLAILPNEELAALKFQYCLNKEEIPIDNRNMQAFFILFPGRISFTAHQHDRIFILFIIAEMAVTGL